MTNQNNKPEKFGIGTAEDYSCPPHDFKYSHIEYPPMGAYTAIPPNKEVVVCAKCGEIRKTIIL